MSDHKELTHPIHGAHSTEPAVTLRGRKVVCMDKKTAGQAHFEYQYSGCGLFWDEQYPEDKESHERIAAAVIAHVRPQIEQEARADERSKNNQAIEILNARQELLNVLLSTTGLDKYIENLIADKIAIHECSSHGEER